MKFFRIKTEADVAGDIGDFNINEEMKDMDWLGGLRLDQVEDVKSVCLLKCERMYENLLCLLLSLETWWLFAYNRYKIVDKLNNRYEILKRILQTSLNQ